MQFKVLGPLVVIEDNGRELPVRRPRERALLALMLLHANEAISPASLVRMLWGDAAPADGSGALRTHIWSLRRMTSVAQRLSHDSGGYTLAVRPGELDADEFRRLAALGTAAIESGVRAEATRLLTGALELWREPPLADVPDTFALQARVRKLLEERRTGHEALISVRLALGHHRGLLPDLEAQTAIDPRNERYWEFLMLARYRSGQRAEALEVYDRVRTMLVSGYGIDPGPRLRRIHQQILADDPALVLLAGPVEIG